MRSSASEVLQVGNCLRPCPQCGRLNEPARSKSPTARPAAFASQQSRTFPPPRCTVLSPPTWLKAQPSKPMDGQPIQARPTSLTIPCRRQHGCPNRHSRLARCDYERVLLSRALHLNSSRMRGSTVEVILWRTGREQVREFVRDSWRRFREFGAALFFFRDSGPPTANANCVYISIYFMVGAPRFELGTPSPPVWELEPPVTASTRQLHDK